ncbi:MAG: hypothetical protein ACI9W4_000880, partial [Rhodothermales bacterium]
EVVRSEYARIQSGLEAYQSVTVEYDKAPYGGRLTGWRDGQTWVKMVEDS